MTQQPARICILEALDLLHGTASLAAALGKVGNGIILVEQSDRFYSRPLYELLQANCKLKLPRLEEILYNTGVRFCQGVVTELI